MEEPKAKTPLSSSMEQTPPNGSKIAFLFSVGKEIDENLENLTRYVDALRTHQCEIDIILTGVIHLSDFLRTRGGDSESKRVIAAFNLDIEWIKKHIDFFIRFEGKYKIQSSLAMKYPELNIQEIVDLFVKPKDESSDAFEDARINTLAKIEAWKKEVQRIIEQTDLVIGSEYQDAIKRIVELTSLNRLEKPGVSREEKNQIRQYQSKISKLIGASHTLVPTKSYLDSESELYLYLWKLGYKFTLYSRGDVNSVLMYLESFILHNQMRHLLLNENGKLVVARLSSPSITPEKISLTPEGVGRKKGRSASHGDAGDAHSLSRYGFHANSREKSVVEAVLAVADNFSEKYQIPDREIHKSLLEALNAKPSLHGSSSSPTLVSGSLVEDREEESSTDDFRPGSPHG